MFNKNEFINWAKTAQNDNKPMQDFRSSHFNPMKQVQQQEAVQVEEGIGKTVVDFSTPILKKAAVKTGEHLAVKGGEAVINKVGDTLTPKKPKPVDVHASYDARKEAGMRAIQELIGPSGISKKNIKKRADNSAAAYDSGPRGFKFGRPAVS